MRGDEWTEKRGNNRGKRVVGAKNKDSWRGLRGSKGTRGWGELAAVQEEERRTRAWRPKGL